MAEYQGKAENAIAAKRMASKKTGSDAGLGKAGTNLLLLHLLQGDASDNG